MKAPNKVAKGTAQWREVGRAAPQRKNKPRGLFSHNKLRGFRSDRAARRRAECVTVFAG